MSTQPTSSAFFTNVHKILSTFVPVQNNREHQNLYSSIGVLSHGSITFSDNKSNRAEFIRVPPNASVMHVKELLSRQWCNGRPSLVISVTGGAKEYNMKPKLLRAFRRGLLKVARTTGAWIITGGMNTGIMKLVGEIVQINPDRSRPIHLIGIATWGCVSGVHQLDVSGQNVHYSKPRSEQKGEAPLEPNHTEFIFVDDGTERKYGREISFRAQLEQAISGGFFSRGSGGSASNGEHGTTLTATQSLKGESIEPVPVVLLVVEGGPNTVRTVHEAVVQNSIPAVFLEGTGRCCDLFAKAYYLFQDYQQKLELTDELVTNLEANVVARRWEELKNKLREDLRNEIRAISGGGDGGSKAPRQSNAEGRKKAPDSTDYFELVYECLYTRPNFLNIISLNSRNPVEPDIDLVILQALLNATSGGNFCKTDIQRRREQLHLALEWNRVDIARNYIMRRSQDWEKMDLNDLFKMALGRNQIGFVRLFLDHDFSMTDLFRSKDNLLKLYDHEFKHIQNLPSLASGDPLRLIYQYIIQPLIGEFFEVNAVLNDSEDFTSYDARKIIDDRKQSCLPCFRPQKQYGAKSNVIREGSMRSEASYGNTPTCIDVDKELFLWSVITGRRDFALLFWSRGKNKICAALIAALIYRSRAHKENDNSFYEAADEFEKLAVEILNKFYQVNAYACTKAIIRQIPTYGNVTWLQLAVAANAKDFIAQKAVQDVLNNIWFGFIDQSVSHTAIIISTIMPLFSVCLRYHNELVKLNETDKYEKPAFYKQNSSQRNNFDKPSDNVQLKLMEGVAEMESTPVDFIDVGCWEKTTRHIGNYFRNLTVFMRAPYVKYLYNLYFHVIFLILFSYVVLSDFFPLYDLSYDMCIPAKQDHKIKSEPNNENNNTGDDASFAYGFQIRNRPSNIEIILIIWIFTLLCEEIRQFISTEAQSFRSALIEYFKVFWNKLDVLAIFLFFVAMVLRFLPSAECFCAARIILSIDISIWFMRSLDIFAAVKRLGPKLVMIGEMVHDLKFFTLMLTVFILAFGISSYSLIYGVQKFDLNIPRQIFNLAYWQIFGELNALELFEESYNPNGYAVFILLVAYMLIVSVLLVNLLIAMFSNTFDRLQNDTDRIWKFQRYSLVCEYLSRPALPPPLIIFPHAWRLILYISARCCNCEWIQNAYKQHSTRTKYKEVLDGKIATNIEIAEDAFGDEVYYNFLKVNHKLIGETDIDEERVVSPQENMFNRVRVLEARIQNMATQQAHMFDYLECLMDGLKVLGGDRVRVPEKRRLEVDESFDELNMGDQNRRTSRRGSLVDEPSHRSSHCADELQNSAINLFASRKFVIT